MLGLETAAASVDRALSILEAVAHSSGGLNNSEISRRLKIPKSSASYILRALERRGYLQRDAGTKKYRLGLRLLDLSRGVLVAPDLRELALPALRHLAERTQLTTHLAILDQDQAVYIEKVEWPGFIKMDTWVGKRMEVHSTSVGKALVAYLPRQEAEAIARSRGLKKRAPRTITGLSAFLRELERVRAQGYAVDDEENSPGVRCVGAPVFNSLGEVEASVGVSGAINQITHKNLPAIAELVQEAARRISKQLGYPGLLRRGEPRRSAL